MAEILFIYDQRNYRQCQQSYRGAENREYYLGHYWIEPSSTVHVRAERRAARAYSIIRLRSKNRLFFRRSWSHIQADATDVAILWFVKHGALRISHQNGQSIVGAGGFAITYSMTPFLMECLTDSESVHEVFHAVIPTHILRRFISAKLSTGFCAPATTPEFAIAARVLEDVFEGTGRMSERSSEHLIEAALSLINDAISWQCAHQPVSKSLGDRRFDDVMHFIEMHFTDPNLSLTKAAKSLGISTRYLSLLLEHRGLHFSTLIWDKRLQAAKEWLPASAESGALVREIAYRVGFKSSAHFSRKFRKAFNMSPQNYRLLGGMALGSSLRVPVQPELARGH